MALSLCAIGVLVWRNNVNELQLQQQKEVTEIIETSIENEVQNGSLLPEVVFISADSSRKQELTDSLLKQITTVLTDKYLYNRELSIDEITLKPFFILPNKPDSSGNYILTEKQLNELKAHIDFLTKQVEKEVDRTKEEVGRDIDRLNTWVSIWIGVIGFLGIFIPIVLNLDVSKRASEAKAYSEMAKSDANKASERANKALDIINNAQPQIDKIDGLEEKVTNADSKSKSAFSKAETAITDTIEVKRNLSVIIAINKLKEFGPQTLIRLNKDQALPYYVNMLKEILIEMKNNAEHFENELMKNWLEQIAINNQSLSLYRFINPEQTRLLNNYAVLVINSLENYNRQKYDQIVNGLEELIANLNTND
ncbi:hypothetical protein [Zobellia uliginosa]|uniref:hypothetical protein n=1 Tax=Zobellia uliginosa TaxID=143224 RepID=UPI0011159A1B|nr:hypothetical protein [Zobellia uliginosa]